MIAFHGKAILLDVEGTVAPLSFVRDTLFPFAREHLDTVLQRRWNDFAVAVACDQIARDGGATFDAWAPAEQVRSWVADEVRRLMDRDAKTTGLKLLQGLIWEEGYRDGRLHSQVYTDVPPALRAWNRRDWQVRIFSSGSVDAQRMFFAHTDVGDLTSYLWGYDDTATGPKREPESYRAIAAKAGFPPAEILYLSDVTYELDAARHAGLVTALMVRPGNKPVQDGHGHPVITDFSQVM